MFDVLALVQRGRVTWRDLGRRDLDVLLRRLLAPEPKERPTSEEAVVALEQAVTRPSRTRRRWLGAAAATFALLTLGAGMLGVRAVEESRAVLAENRGRRVAVLPFRNETGDPSLRWVEAASASSWPVDCRPCAALRSCR